VLKKFFLFASICLFTFFGFYGNASATPFSLGSNARAATSEVYLCKAEGLGDTTDKINIEFLYSEVSTGILQNLYIKISKLEGRESKNWDAHYSTDADLNFWTTPVLRDIATGTDPLLIVQEPDVTKPGYESLEADFYSGTYPVECSISR